MARRSPLEPSFAASAANVLVAIGSESFYPSVSLLFELQSPYSKISINLRDLIPETDEFAFKCIVR